ncbi:MAG: hypothetical protein DRG09_05405 [Epsilonproteobacteria bacterium]|nr:MAG: hypothetical protein DRG09_05405 [Campylobacterota bacterium]
MKQIFILFTILSLSLFAIANESKICQQCHPIIYNEYYKSSHRKASVVNNSIHKAYWEKHPKDDKSYTCAKCHSPSDKKLMQTGILEDNDIQKDEPISCVYCHTIKNVDSGKMSNTNIITDKNKEFFSAETSKKNLNTAKFEIESSWFGLVKKSKNSPYHKIDYSNENYYNGNVCMGCHSHTNNEHDFDIVMLDALIDKDDKNTCVTCHMPQVLGSKVTINKTKTHAFHGIAGIYHMNKEMGKYIDFNVTQDNSGFHIDVINKSNHALFGQALREGKLKVSIERKGKTITLKPFVFTRILAKDGKETMPWNATATLKDTLIYAHKKIDFTETLQKGDILTLTLGVQLLTKKGAKALGLEKNEEVSRFRILKTQKFKF